MNRHQTWDSHPSVSVCVCSFSFILMKTSCNLLYFEEVPLHFHGGSHPHIFLTMINTIHRKYPQLCIEAVTDGTILPLLPLAFIFTGINNVVIHN